MVRLLSDLILFRFNLALLRSVPVGSCLRSPYSGTLVVFSQTATSDMAKDGSWILENLAKELSEFDDQPRPLMAWEQPVLERYRDLFQETPASRQKRSKTRRSERSSVFNLFSDIFKTISQEVFLLCIFAGSITKWSTVDNKRSISIIRAWWRTAICPAGLKTSAHEVCEAYQFSRLISPASQIPSSDTVNHGDTDARVGFLTGPPYEPSESEGAEPCNPSLHWQE